MILLSITLAITYTLGSILTSTITGWHPNKTTELLKLLFWPITLFTHK
jgi:hypothetical protein